MRDLRQGNDLAVIWSILRDGKPFNLSGKKLKLYLKNMYERREVDGFTARGNQIHWTFYGKDQKTTGKYSLILVANEDAEGMITTDTCDFVRLVSCTCKIENGIDSPNVEIETIELTSELEYVANAGGSGEGGSYDDTLLWEALDNKVDKVDGKGLSSNDFTDADVEKLARLENYDDAKLKEELSETYQPKGDYVETKNLATINGKPLNEGGDIEIESGSGGASIEVDSSLSTTSTNPVQNKVITAELNKKAETGAIPTKLSQLTDNVGFAKQADVEAGYQPKGDYVTDDKLSSKGYATEKYVDDALEGKQDTIEDLDSIRSGAGKGATAVQPSALEDYATTQQLTELSSEVGKKQDTISDLKTIRSGAAKGATALQSVPDSYATKTYVDEKVAQSGGQGGGEPSQYIKDATTSADGNTLTLTKKDGSVVSFSPSGGGGGSADLSAIAKWGVLTQTLKQVGNANDGYVVQVSNPVMGWIPQSFIDEVTNFGGIATNANAGYITGKPIFNAETGYFEYQGITNLAYDEMRAAYTAGRNMFSNGIGNYLYAVQYRDNITSGVSDKFRCILHYPIFNEMGYYRFHGFCRYLKFLEIGIVNEAFGAVSFIDNGLNYAFMGCATLRRCGCFEVSQLKSTPAAFTGSPSMEEVYLKGLKVNINFGSSPLLKEGCILYMIQNAAATGITITLHPTAYDRAEANAEIQAAKDIKGVSLAMA